MRVNNSDGVNPSAPRCSTPWLTCSLQAGHADFEELVEVGAHDAQKFQSLQQRDLLVFGQVKYPPIKLQKAQLPIYKPFRAKDHWWKAAAAGAAEVAERQMIVSCLPRRHSQ